jgi:hypothetical protein
MHPGKSIPGPRLLGDTPQCNGAILGIKHGQEHPFKIFIFEHTKCTEQNVRTFLHGLLTTGWKAHHLNGAFHTLCSILKFVVVSAIEAKLGALFFNCQERMVLKLTFKDLSHMQQKNTSSLQQHNCRQYHK